MRRLEVFVATLRQEASNIGTAVADELEEVINDLDVAAEILETTSAEVGHA
jgi:hypothetical protein